MKCDLCHNEEAVVFIEQIGSDEKTRKINLCLKCANERGISNFSSSPQKINIDAVFKELDDKTAASNPDLRTLCPVCGSNL